MSWECPVCGYGSERVFIVRREYWVRDCVSCRHRFAEWSPPPGHVADAFSDDYFMGGGAGYPDYLREAEILRRHGIRYASLLSKYVRPGTLLDVGAAAGFISDAFRSRGWNVEGLEPNPGMVQYARAHLGLSVRLGTLEDFGCGTIYDLITMIQVVQHFTDIRHAMHVAVQHLRPGGLCLIETWNNRSRSARIFGSRWHVYNPPTVLHYFSISSLERLCAQFRLSRVAVGRPAKYIGWGHAKSLLLHHVGKHRWVRLLDRIPEGLSIRYPADDLFWMLFEKQSEPA